MQKTSIQRLDRKIKKKTQHVTHLRSCRRSFALSIVMSEVVAAGMMTIGVRDPLSKLKEKLLKKKKCWTYSQIKAAT